MNWFAGVGRRADNEITNMDLKTLTGANWKFKRSLGLEYGSHKRSRVLSTRTKNGSVTEAQLGSNEFFEAYWDTTFKGC